MSPPRCAEPGWAHTGAILAGGHGARMGRPKHELAWEGTTMIEAVGAALRQVCREVVVVGASVAGCRALGDLRPGAGPLGGIEALLASGIDTEYLVCPCDVPLVTAGLLARLAVPDTALASVFRVEGEPRFRPLPVRISSAALPAVRDHLDRGQRAVYGLLGAVEPREVAVGADESRALDGLNTPQEYQAALRQVQGASRRFT